MRAGALGLVLTAAFALTACDPNEVGAAALVDGDRLSVDQLQEQVETYADTLPNKPSVARLDLAAFQRNIVQEFVQHQLFERIAKDRRIDVTEGDIDAQLKPLRARGQAAYLAQLAQQGYTEHTVRAVVYDQLVAKELGGATAAQKALGEESAKTEVWVAPRYGTWRGGAVEGTSGSLSVPVGPSPAAPGAGEPSPSATPSG